ncbi:fungal-specific transcription factor domain-containing protein [Terfezia claveryi]|nr:fungal-specific transcription factor domain-containing protein [Terfezia claveryi]
MAMGQRESGASSASVGARTGGSAPPASNPEAGPLLISPSAVEKKSIRTKKLRIQKAITPLGPTADADCYTCRRRRVRCDRGLPVCRKCVKAEHECTGYKKGFRWVGGIASRGKMMGKRTFDEEEDGEDGDREEKGRSEMDGGYQMFPVCESVGGGSQVAVMRGPPNTEMTVFEEDGRQSGEIAMGELMMDSPQLTLAENYNYVTSIAMPSLYSRRVVEPSALDLGIDFVTVHSEISEETFPEETQEALDSDITSLPLLATSGGSFLDDYIAATATQWSRYFDTSSNYSYSRARSRRYYRISPNGADVYGKQYTLSLCVGPPATMCVSGSSSSKSTGFYVSIASLVDFYVSTPSAAPSMIGCLDAMARYYLSYFDQMCGIFLLFDRHPLNPYRELLLSTLHFSEPALLSTILAVAARYHANVTGHHYNSSGHRLDLIYYNQALNYLNQDLQDEDRMLEDTTLASVLFFLFYETMDSGLDTWRIHLSGARKLVELKYGRMQMQQGGEGELTHMQAFILHSIALFDIIGSTLVTDRQPSVLPSLSATPTTPSTFQYPSPSPSLPTSPTTATNISTALTHLDTTVLPILTQGEIFCFLACPPTLLHLILKTTLLSSHPYLSTSTPPPHLLTEFHLHRTNLLNQIISFDPAPWLQRHNSQSTITADEDDLLHHVGAYKTAVLIYLYRSLYLPYELLGEGEGEGDADVDMEQLAERLFFHLDQIPTRGPLYKGTVWPCFIAGTEARNRIQKDRVRKHFGRLWEVLYCENVRNGMTVLEELWGEKGGVVREEEKGGEEGAAGSEGVGKEEFGGGWSRRRRAREIGDGTSINSRRGGTVGGGHRAGGMGIPGGGQDWKGYLKRKGVEWLFI